jgi:tRNA(Phe) wybutosine-synthesizing methylase Tyw3
VVLLLKIIGPLEAMESNYSKKLILAISPFSGRIVVSFATESMNKRTRFRWSRKWLTSFIEKNFEVLDDFESGGERYLVFRKKAKFI